MFVLAIPPVVFICETADQVPASVLVLPLTTAFGDSHPTDTIVISPLNIPVKVYDNVLVVPCVLTDDRGEVAVALVNSKTIIHLAVIEALNVAVMVLVAEAAAVVINCCANTPVPALVVVGADCIAES